MGGVEAVEDDQEDDDDVAELAASKVRSLPFSPDFPVLLLFDDSMF